VAGRQADTTTQQHNNPAKTPTKAKHICGFYADIVAHVVVAVTYASLLKPERELERSTTSQPVRQPTWYSGPEAAFLLLTLMPAHRHRHRSCTPLSLPAH